MTDAERLAAMASDEMYWKGLAVLGAAEFTAPPPVSSPQINSKGEVQMFAPSPILPGQTIAHWAKDHAQSVVMEQPGLTLVIFADIDATKEAMIDLGWGFQTPPASGAVAWVDFNFAGEEFGTEALPFNTFGAAVSFVTEPGTVNIKPGTSPEILTVDKAMTVNAVGGSATIGFSSPRRVFTHGEQETRTGFISRTRTQ